MDTVKVHYDSFQINLNNFSVQWDIKKIPFVPVYCHLVESKETFRRGIDKTGPKLQIFKKKSIKKFYKKLRFYMYLSKHCE